MNYGQCYNCGTTEEIVFSGVDAFVLGCMDKVGYVCYAHAIQNEYEGTLI